jgi:YD repeat-containing protein
MAKYIFDSRGRVIGRECGDQMFDEHGMLVARFSRNGQTYDDHGKLVGKGDQRMLKLGRDED